MPRTPKQSARLGVSLSSMLASGRPRYSASGWPTGASAGSSIRPEASASTPSSLAEQSMPCDSTRRSLAALMAMPPGSLAPTVASGTFRPARALGAPQTICTVPAPVATWQTCRRSASGCFSQERISATTTPSRPSPSTVRSSTSRPMPVRPAASSSRDASTVTCSRSQLSGNLIAALPGSGELPQEAAVVFEEAAQVVDAVAQHGQAFNAQAEGEAGVALGVDADVAQHVRMHHAAAQHLQPAGAAVGLLPGDVHLGRGLGEGEVAGAEAHLEIALEEGADELRQRALEVGEAGALVHQQALDLVEHRRVGLVAVAAVDLAGGDHAQRRRVLLHEAHLHARGVGAQQPALAALVGAHVEGVVHGPRRMVRREVQGLEVVPVVLDLRAFGQLVTHAGEDVGDALQGAADRVQVAQAR